MGIIKQKIVYDNEAILQQSNLITDEYYMIREYYMNCTDSAADFYDPVKGEYTKDIIIEIIKKGGSGKERKIIIKDNCSGMSINPNKPYTIFRSNKRNNPKYSGMYGMGSCLSLAFLDKIHYETKRSSSKIIYSFEITPRIFKKTGKHNMEMDINTVLTNKTDRNSGTTVTLSDFHQGVFEEIDFNILKYKIENDSEQILSRKGISIYLTENDKPPVKCEPFKYSDYCQNPFVKILDTLYITNSRKYRTKTEISIAKNPVKIFIIASENTNINKEIYVSVHGHKVVELSKVDQFRSNNKSKLSRLNVGGYIDATGVLIPTPTRKEFIKTKLSKAFFHTFGLLESEIIKYIDSSSKPFENGKLQMLENKINTVLEKFDENQSDDALEIGENDTFKGREYTLLGYKIRESEKSESLKNVDTAKPNTVKVAWIKRKRERNHKFTVQYPTKYSVNSNLSLKIDTLNEPFKDINGKVLRSVVRNSQIIVFQKHPEFKTRLSQSAKGFYEINERIIHYISMEIITKLKEIKNESLSQISEHIYENFVTSVLTLEDELKMLVGERI